MNGTFWRALIALVPVSALFFRSLLLFLRSRSASSFFQLFGAGGLVIVVLTHLCEALNLFPWMHWGLQHSAGHYLDLASAIFGVTLLTLGYLFEVISKRHA